MKKEILIEVLDNGLVLKDESGWSKAVLFNEKEMLDDDAQFRDCQQAIGKLFTDQAFGECTDLAKESRDMYEKRGFCTFGYRLEVKVTPLAGHEIKFKNK